MSREEITRLIQSYIDQSLAGQIIENPKFDFKDHMNMILEKARKECALFVLWDLGRDFSEGNFKRVGDISSPDNRIWRGNFGGEELERR